MLNKLLDRIWGKCIERKKPRYYCINCGKLFYTGKYWWNDMNAYEDICPNCGAMGYGLKELSEAFEHLTEETDNGKN